MAQGEIIPRGRESRGLGRPGGYGLFSPLSRVFEDFFESAFPDFLSARATETAGFMPRINMNETQNEIRISAELPGMDEKDIEVLATQEGVTLRGEKRVEREEGEGGRTYRELSYGAFERFIPITADVDEQQVRATFDRGVLHITLPKTEQAKSRARRIEVKRQETQEGQSH